jgi:hypothetical protein
MHRSRPSGFIIDCRDADLESAAGFWAAALGMATAPSVAPEDDGYVPLDASARDLCVEVQRVTHASRVHLDLESDDVEAEVRRLEALGARRLRPVRDWWVMEAPTGQRFCVVPAKGSLQSRSGVNEWP